MRFDGKDYELQLYNACFSNDVPTIAVLTSPQNFTQNPTPGIINRGMEYAATRGGLEAVQYILDHPGLQPYINDSCFNQLFSCFCESGNLAALSYLINHARAGDYINLCANDSECLINACKAGHLDIVNYLLTSPEVTRLDRRHSDINAREENCETPLIQAVQKGHMEVVRFLVESPDIEKGKHARLHANNYHAVRRAFTRGHTDICRYLIESSQWKKKASVQQQDLLNELLLDACQHRSGSTVKVLVKTPQSPEEKYIRYADIHVDEDQAMSHALSTGKNNIVEFLVLEAQIEKTAAIEKLIDQYPYLGEIFERRQLNNELNENLPAQSSGKRHKI